MYEWNEDMLMILIELICRYKYINNFFFYVIILPPHLLVPTYHCNRIAPAISLFIIVVYQLYLYHHRLPRSGKQGEKVESKPKARKARKAGL